MEDEEIEALEHEAFERKERIVSIDECPSYKRLINEFEKFGKVKKNIKVKCPKCKSKKIVKNGFGVRNHKRIQRYLCKKCFHVFLGA